MTDATTVKFSMSIAPALFVHIEEEASVYKRSASEQIVRILLRHIRTNGGSDDPLVEREGLFWDLIDRTEETARRMFADKGFSPDITLDVVRACTKDPDWIGDYRKFVGDDVYKNGNPEKGRINKEIGFRVKRAIGAETAKINGKPVMEKVLGEIIQSYSRLAMPQQNDAA